MEIPTNRQDLINVIAEDTETSEATATCFLDSSITIVQNEVAGGGVVEFAGFGTFEKTTVAVRTGRNPKTDMLIKIPSVCKSKFTFGAMSKDLVRD